jgi:hypothetical protein
MTGVDSSDTPEELGAIALQLFNMEPRSGLERHLGIDLNLYQLESP